MRGCGFFVGAKMILFFEKALKALLSKSAKSYLQNKLEIIDNYGKNW